MSQSSIGSVEASSWKWERVDPCSKIPSFDDRHASRGEEGGELLVFDDEEEEEKRTEQLEEAIRSLSFTDEEYC